MNISPQITRNGNKINRLLVQPIKRDIPESQIIKPLFALVKYGEITSVCEGSEFSAGDKVEYLWPDENHPYEIVHEKEAFDFIFEREVVTHNGEPHNVLFVEQLSKLEQTKEGIFINPETKGITAKGKIAAAPKNSPYQVNKTVEYRKNEKNRDLYPQIYHNGILCEVLKFPDVFKYSGHVSDDRIIIRIDRKAQYKKQKKTESGVQVPNMFRYMRFFLQYGEVMEIGCKAKEWYPNLEIGDMAILHHFVEGQPHRILSQNNDWEYRICETYDPMSREIMGVMKKNNLGEWIITPFGKQIFLNPDIMPFDETYNPQIDANKHTGGKETPFTTFVGLLDARQKKGNENYEYHLQQLNYEGRKLNADKPEDVVKAGEIDQEITKLQQEKLRIDSFMRRNFLVITDQVKPKLEGSKVAVPYQGLYPISLMGKDYLIGHENFVVAHIKNESK